MSATSSLRQRLRVLLWELLVGLVVGVLFWELLGRWLLAMKYGSFSSSLSCATDVNRALAEFDSGLRWSAIAGALGGIVLMFAFRIWRRRRKAKQAAPATGKSGGAPGNPVSS
jgi:hypothetical protein